MKMLTVERMLVAAVLIVTSVAWTGRVTAQAPQTPPDVLPALLAEVRGLRAAMEQMASAGPRIQLFTARLQLQEARIGNLVRRLDTVRDTLDASQRELRRVQQDQRNLESAVAEQRASTSPEAREELKQAEFMLEQAKGTVASRKQTVDRLAAEEAQLSQEIGTEQGRWTEINGRLDELERLLTRK